MSYSVTLMTDELMLEPSEAREIFDAFFEDAYPLLQEGKAALQAGDGKLLSRKMHTLKGSALNLRMEDLGSMAAQAEKQEELSEPELMELLAAIEVELAAVEKNITAFYKGKQ